MGVVAHAKDRVEPAPAAPYVVLNNLYPCKAALNASREEGCWGSGLVPGGADLGGAGGALREKPEKA